MASRSLHFYSASTIAVGSVSAAALLFGGVLLSPCPALAQTTLPQITSGGTSSAVAPVAPAGIVTQAVRSGDVIRAVQIKGTERIDPATVRSYMTLDAGDSFTPAGLDGTLKRLYATGLFTNVELTREGNILVVSVRENPVINQVTFEGNDALETDALQQEIQLRSRNVYTRPRVQEDTQRLLDLYRRSGRFAATIEPKIVELQQNRVDLIFEIDEGDKTYVKRVAFVNNGAFGDSRLRGVLSTKESAWYRLLSADDVYDPDRLNYDEELLRQFYLEQGYADFRVVSTVAELAPDRSGFFITLTVDEGERYHVGKVSFVSDIPRVRGSDFAALSQVEPGAWLNGKLVERTASAITEALGNRGYAFAEARPDYQRNPEKRTVDIVFRMGESARVFVERINITGNVRTLDRVIRREIPLAEGDAFSGEKLREAERKLRNLGYFKTIKLDVQPGSAPDRSVINVAVEEQSTGELSFGAGFSSTESLLADVRLRERNFLGRGQDVRVATTFSGLRQEFDIGYTEPYFLDTNLRAGVDLFHITRELREDSVFDERRTGGGLRLGYDITENLSQTLRYVVRQVNITDIDPLASRFIKEQEGETLTSSIGQELTYDTRDNIQLPTSGYYIRYATEFAGVGGDVDFLRNSIGSGFFVPVAGDEWVWSFESNTGYVFGWSGEDIRINDRFFIGGDDLRGFKLAGVGPRDLATDDPLGGNMFFTASTELRFPLGLPEELGVTGRSFIDAGTVSQSDSEGTGVVDSGSIRASAGVGLAWQSPFGPVRIDFAQAIAKEDYDETEFFRFSFGTQF
jgi:outer membrane protein insertion porin family